MANYIDRLINPSSSSITEMTTDRTGVMNHIEYNTSPSWSAALDKKYGTNLMGEEGISRTNGASILNNIASQNADAVRQSAPIVKRNAAVRDETMRGLLSQAKAVSSNQPAQPQQYQGKETANIRQRRQSAGRHRSARHSYTQQ